MNSMKFFLNSLYYHTIVSAYFCKQKKKVLTCNICVFILSHTCISLCPACVSAASMNIKSMEWAETIVTEERKKNVNIKTQTHSPFVPLPAAEADPQQVTRHECIRTKPTVKNVVAFFLFFYFQASYRPRYPPTVFKN